MIPGTYSPWSTKRRRLEITLFAVSPVTGLKNKIIEKIHCYSRFVSGPFVYSHPVRVKGAWISVLLLEHCYVFTDRMVTGSGQWQSSEMSGGYRTTERSFVPWVKPPCTEAASVHLFWPFLFLMYWFLNTWIFWTLLNTKNANISEHMSLTLSFGWLLLI